MAVSEHPTAALTDGHASPPGLTLVGRADCVEALEATLEIRVLVADGQALVRAGLRVLLESCGRFCVVGEAGTGEEAVALARRLRPDVALVDTRLPGLDPVEATDRMFAESGVPNRPIWSARSRRWPGERRRSRRSSPAA